MIVNFKYTVEVDTEGRFLCYLPDKELENLPLPVDVKESISSMAVTLDTAKYQLGERLSPKDKGDKILQEFDRLFTTYLKDFDIVPCIILTGDVNQLDNAYKGRSLFIVHPESISDNEILELEHGITFISKITLLCVSESVNAAYFKMVTSDHQLALSILNNIRHTKRNNTSRFEKYDIDRIMRSWYPEEDERVKLIDEAKAVIDSFIFIKELNVYIPNYFVVSSFNIKRFKHAQDILNAKYHPRFIMTLPCRVSDKEYTVLFPIIKGPKFR